jgi:hypothetical protein
MDRACSDPGAKSILTTGRGRGIQHCPWKAGVSPAVGLPGLRPSEKLYAKSVTPGAMRVVPSVSPNRGRRLRIRRCGLFFPNLTMQKLRSLHLYLGCVFAPLLLFFAISGIWQTLGFDSGLLRRLSSIHTEHPWKDGSQWGSVPLRAFILLMAASFVVTTILGVVLALRSGRSRRAALVCLLAGFLVPLVLVLWRVLA